jgi:hypothetical protein
LTKASNHKVCVYSQLVALDSLFRIQKVVFVQHRYQLASLVLACKLFFKKGPVLLQFQLLLSIEKVWVLEDAELDVGSLAEAHEQVLGLLRQHKNDDEDSLE